MNQDMGYATQGHVCRRGVLGQGKVRWAIPRAGGQPQPLSLPARLQLMLLGSGVICAYNQWRGLQLETDAS